MTFIYHSQTISNGLLSGLHRNNFLLKLYNNLSILHTADHVTYRIVGYISQWIYLLIDLGLVNFDKYLSWYANRRY